jgi:hypothetical protein
MGADDEFYNEHVLADLVGQGCLNDEQIVYGNVLIRGDAPWAKDNSIYAGPFPLEKLFLQNICHQSIFYPRSVIKKVGYYTQKYTTTADWDYNLRCYSKYKFSYIDKIISIFLTGGISSKEGDILFDAIFPEKIIEYFQLDLDDPSIHLPGSPFFYPLSRYRREKDFEEKNALYEERKALFKDREYLRNQITNQQIENNNTVQELKAEHSSLITELEDRYAADISQLKKDFNDTLAKMKDENLNNIIETKELQLKQHANKMEQEISRLKQIISEKEHEILVIYNSATWKTGKVLLSPLKFLIRK